MFAPPLYIVRKLNLTYIINHDYNIQISQEEEERFYVKQGDNMLFRQSGCLHTRATSITGLLCLWIAWVARTRRRP